MNNTKKEPVPNKINNQNVQGKSAITPLKVSIYIGIALIIGFIGGIKFADHANKKMTGTPTGNIANMPEMNAGMSDGMPPGKVNMDIPQAIAKMEEMLKKDTKNQQLLEHLGNLYYDTNQYKKAIEMYEQALAINRNNPDVLTDCGFMYRAIKNYDKAIAYFQEATRISPTHFQSWYNLGMVYREDLKEYQKAVEAWNQILMNIPNSEHTEMIKSEIQKTKELMK